MHVNSGLTVTAAVDDDDDDDEEEEEEEEEPRRLDEVVVDDVAAAAAAAAAAAWIDDGWPRGNFDRKSISDDTTALQTHKPHAIFLATSALASDLKFTRSLSQNLLLVNLSLTK